MVFASSTRVYVNILDTIGDTPLLKLNRLPKTFDAKSNIYIKCEFFNPGGSVKDRICKAMIEDAERRKLIKPGYTIIESTSGNTGIGLAMVAAVKGYNLICVVLDKVSEEKINLLKAFGSEVVVTPSSVNFDDPRNYFKIAEILAKMVGKKRRLLTKMEVKKLVVKLQQLIDENKVDVLERILKEKIDFGKNTFIPKQHYNPVNPETHYLTTAKEIWKQTKGKIDILVAGMATGGTITGCARYLKRKNPKIKIIGVDPEGSLFHEKFYGTSGEIHQYRIEGIGEDFIPGTIDLKVLDEIFVVNDKDAFLTARSLAKEEGILAGGSSGAALFAALQIAKKLSNKNIVVILPDTGRNYISKIYSDNWMEREGLIKKK